MWRLLELAVQPRDPLSGVPAPAARYFPASRALAAWQQTLEPWRERLGSTTTPDDP